jgi:DNA-binding NarL/FixJ family response regulator
MINILIADDHTMFVDGIESILKDERGMKVVGRCYNGADVIDFIAHNDVNIVLLDVNLPDISGIEVCKKITEKYKNIKVLAISMYNEESYVSEIVNNGAIGYILKNTGREELLTAIKTVFKGENFFSREVSETIMKATINRKNAEKSPQLPKLSRREKEILKMIIDGDSTQQIADSLFISIKTVESHRSNLLAKFNARNSTALVKIVMENGLLNE